MTYALSHIAICFLSGILLFVFALGFTALCASFLDSE
jgi:hypothetical protein